MPLFRSNYNKPGPGVKKDEPRKKGAVRFFELLLRDLGDLIKLNVLFCIALLPTGALFVLSLFGVYTPITFGLSLLLSFPVGGALVACVYYISKMMRDDPSYVWHEFKRKFKENFKQAAPIGMLCTAFIYSQIWIWGSLYGVLVADELVSDLFWYLATLLALLLFTMIAPYVFLHFAYIDLKTSQIIKNSFLMAFAYFPRSFMGAITGGVLWIVFALYMPVSMVAFPFILLIAVSLTMMLNLMWVWPPFNDHFKVEETLIEQMKNN